jgi:omega-amidase
MPREVTVALVQMAPELANPEANLRKMGDFVEKICSEQKTDLIVFPELSYTGTELGLRATDLAERVPGHATNYLAKRANEFNVYVVFGMVIKERVESILYNGVVCLGPEGDVVGDYRKVHLLGEERQVYRNGFRFQTVEAEWGRFGMLIGADLAFPEAARSLTLDGAELVTVSANWEQQLRRIVARASDQPRVRELDLHGGGQSRGRRADAALHRRQPAGRPVRRSLHRAR